MQDIFIRRWSSVLEKYDPYYNRKLTQEGPTFVEDMSVEYGKENLI